MRPARLAWSAWPEPANRPRPRLRSVFRFIRINHLRMLADKMVWRIQNTEKDKTSFTINLFPGTELTPANQRIRAGVEKEPAKDSP